MQKGSDYTKMQQFKYRKLRGKIIEKYGSLGEFSNALQQSFVTISNKMNGKTGFSQDDIIRWSKLLDIDLDDAGAYFFA